MLKNGVTTLDAGASSLTNAFVEEPKDALPAKKMGGTENKNERLHRAVCTLVMEIHFPKNSAPRIREPLVRES
jgi:hypothetical protein